MKRKYDFLNDMEFNMNDYVRNDLDDLDRYISDKFIGNLKYRNKIKKVNYILVASLLLFSILNMDAIKASTVNFINNIEYKFSEITGNIKYNDFSSIVHSSVESGGVQIQIEEVIFYEDRMDITFLIDNHNKKDNNIDDLNLYIDDKKVDISGKTGNSFEKNNITYTNLSFHFNKDVSKFVNKNSKVDLFINSVCSLNDGKVINGNWKFNFLCNSKILKKSETVYVNKELNNEDISVKIDKAILRPTNNLEMKSEILRTSKKGKELLERNTSLIIVGENSTGEKIELFENKRDKEISYFVQSKEDRQKQIEDLTDYTFKMYFEEYRDGELSERKEIGEKFKIKNHSN